MSSKDNQGNIFFIMFFFINIIAYLKVVDTVEGQILFLLIGMLSFMYIIFKNSIYDQKSILLFLFFYTMNGMICFLFNNNMDIQELLWPIAFEGIAILLLNIKINYKISKIIYYGLSIFMLLKIYFVGDANYINVSSSRNSVSAIILFYFCIYAISSYQNNKRVTILPVAFGLVVSIMAVGRSGILSFILLLVLLIPLKYKDGYYKFSNPIKIIIMIFIVAIILIIGYKYLNDFFGNTIRNFTVHGLKSVRVNIWTDYILKICSSPKYLIFGAPINGTYYLDLYSENLHNSFLMLHAKYGIVIVISIIFLGLNSLRYFYKTNNKIYLITFFTVLFRMQFDYTNFNGWFDPIFFYYLFYPFYESKRKISNFSVSSTK